MDVVSSFSAYVSLNSLSDRAKWASEWFADDDKLKRVHRCVGENRAAGDERIRIAILDSGIDVRHSEMASNIVLDVPSSCSEEQKEAVQEANIQRHIKAWRGFPATLDPLRDRVGHGTHCASVILRTAHYSSLYIARIFDDDKKISDCDQVVKAFEWAIDEQVDIISVSWGMPTTVQPIEQIINKAIDDGIIILAAAGNHGSNFDIPFPSRMDMVFCIGSAHGRGHASEFNPPHRDVIEKYSVLGEEVVAAYFHNTLDSTVHEKMQARSGTSVAVPVAAGIAANMLEYITQITDRPQGPDATLVMRKLFLAMSVATRGKNYRNLVPWELFKYDTGENQRRFVQIMADEPESITVGNISTTSHQLALSPEDKFMVPYQRNERFIGRQKLLQLLRETLFSEEPKNYNRRVALYGLGGIGKTQVALEYVFANQTYYEHIYWVSAATQAALVHGYQCIARRIGLKSAHRAVTIEFIPDVLQWFRRSEKWLLIIDNLDDIEVLDPTKLFSKNDLGNSSISETLLPENGPTKHTIITTRSKYADWIPAAGLEIPMLTCEEAVDMLFTLTGVPLPQPGEQQVAQEIVKELGYLPLAIEQAAAYTAQMYDKSFSRFFRFYKTNRSKVHQWLPVGRRHYSESIATTWKMSAEAVKDSSIDAANLLKFFAYLGPDFISVPFLKAGCDGVDDDLKRIIVDEDLFDEALFTLKRFSFIKREESPERGDVIGMHRLLQAFLQDETELYHSNASMISNVIRFFTHAFPEFLTNESRSQCRIYQEQIVEALGRIKITDISDSALVKDSALIRRRVGNFLREDGKYKDSERLLSQAVEIYKSLSGSQDPDKLTAMHALGLTYEALDKSADAVKILEEVLESQRKTLGEEHPDTLRTMHYLACSYRSNYRTKKAAEMQEKVLKARRKVLGQEHVETLMTMHQLGWTYGWLCRVKEAAKLQVKVLEARRRILGEEHPDTLAVMHSLSIQYNSLGRTQEAANIGEKVLGVRRRILGDDHPLTLHSMHNLAWSYNSLGNAERGVLLMQEAFERSKKVLGEEHRDTVDVMESLISLYRTVGRIGDAVKLQEKKLDRSRRNLGEEHISTLTVLVEVALSYISLGRIKEASGLLEKVNKVDYTRFVGQDRKVLEQLAKAGLRCRSLAEKHEEA